MLPSEGVHGMAEQGPTQTPADERTIIDAIADLLQTIVDWLRQEASALMREKVVLPLQRLGFTMAAASGAVSLMVMGLFMVSIASLLLLAQWLTWPGALYLIGGLLLIGSTIFLYFRQKLVQK